MRGNRRVSLRHESTSNVCYGFFPKLKDFRGEFIMHSSLKTITAAAVIGIGAFSLSSPANAGWGCGWGCGWGSALAGFGVGAIVGSALAAPPVYAVPPPPSYYYGPTAYGPPYYYGQAGYGPPPAYYGHAYYGQAGYGPPDYDGQAGYRPPPRTPSGYSNRRYPPSNTPPHVTTDAQRAGMLPSATAKTGAITASKQKMEAKLKLAQAKAKRDGVASLTQEDLKGLSPEQIKQLRGY
jgi:hypothetical protein